MVTFDAYSIRKVYISACFLHPDRLVKLAIVDVANKASLERKYTNFIFFFPFDFRR